MSCLYLVFVRIFDLDPVRCWDSVRIFFKNSLSGFCPDFFLSRFCPDSFRILEKTLPHLSVRSAKEETELSELSLSLSADVCYQPQIRLFWQKKRKIINILVRILTDRVFKLRQRYIPFISTRFCLSFSLNEKIRTSYFHCITRRCFFMSF